MRRERGSALITVILIILVLTMVGLAAAVYMSVEDRISSNDRLMKEALYAAEAGLRVGEGSLATQMTSGKSITNLLSMSPGTTATPAVNPGVPVMPTAQTSAAYDLAHLGTYLYDSSGANPLVNQAVAYNLPGGAAAPERAFYSLYIRNNPDDISGSPTEDQDAKLVIISVGYITDINGNVLATKILGEGFNLGSQYVLGAQTDWNAGATNAQ